VEPDDLINDLGEIREIVTALSHVWDVPVLILLARRPLRFMAIKRTLDKSAPHKLDPKAVDITLKRLTQQRYIHRLGSEHVSPYAITARGRWLLARIRAVIETDREERRKISDNGGELPQPS